MQKSFSDPTPETLAEVKNLAALFFTPREVAMMLELPIGPFIAECEKQESRYYEAFHSGRLQSEVDLRTSIIKLARSGSSPAQTMSMDLLKLSIMKMRDR